MMFQWLEGLFIRQKRETYEQYEIRALWRRLDLMANEIANLNNAVSNLESAVTVVESEVAALKAGTINPADVQSATDRVSAATARLTALSS